MNQQSNQPQNQRKFFAFPAGTGVIRAKVANADANFAVMLQGRICVPGIGQCFVDGTRSKDAKSVTLDVRNVKRKLVAKLQLPVLGKPQIGDVAEGTLMLTDESGRLLPKNKREDFAVLGEIRVGERGFHQSLRLGTKVEGRFKPVAIAPAQF